MRDIIDQLVVDGHTNIVAARDFNEGPKAEGETPANLSPLFDGSSPVVDVYALPERQLSGLAVMAT